MPRGRGDQHPKVYRPEKKGADGTITLGPSWFVRPYEYDAEGNRTQPAKYVGPATGPDRLTKKEAQHKADEEIIAPLNRRNRRPSSSMLVEDFSKVFDLHVVEKKKKAGQVHYRYLLKAFVLPAIGHRRLSDVGMADVEEMLAVLRRGGYSHQTLEHAKNCVSAIFRHARRLKLYQDENPAHDIEMGEKPAARKRGTYSWRQAALVFAGLKSNHKEFLMAKTSTATSMNVAEMCGTREKRCNFTGSPIVVEGEVLGPYVIAVRENYYRNTWGSVKAGKRYRNVSLTPELAAELAELLTGDPERPLFSSRNGTPLDAHNIASRVFKPLQRKLGFPVTWHAFRRAHSSFVGEFTDVPLEDRVATMGHADARMTLHYSIADVERRRQIPARILERIAQEKVPDLEEMKTEGVQ